jgi:pimeloyl-ACP methyl ester carboxylesterase
VCIPGLNSGAYMFTGVKATLPNWRIIRFATPGVPGVPLPLPFSAKAYAKHVQQHLNSLPPAAGPLVVLGHSLGGYTAQELARLLGRQMTRLILVATSGGQPHTARDVANMEAKMGKSFWQYMKDLQADPANGLLPLFGLHFPIQYPQAYQNFLALRAACAPQGGATLAQLTAGGLFSSARWAHKLTQPTLVLHGTEDILVTPESGKALAAALPNAHLLLLHGIGHFPPLEHPNFWQYVADFCHGQHLGDKIMQRSGWGQWLRDLWERQG